MNVFLTIYLILAFRICLALSQSTGHHFEVKSQTGLQYDRNLIRTFNTTQLDCIINCANVQTCHVVSFILDRICSLYSIKAYHHLVYSDSSTVFIKNTYLSEYLNGLINYWTGLSDGIDVISGANLFGGVNVIQTSNRIDKPYSSFLFNYGYYRVPPGVYFNGDFTVSAWVKLTRYGRFQRLIDFGNPQVDNVLITISHDGSNHIGFSIFLNNFITTMKSKTELRIAEWEHLAVTLRGSTGYIYINGIFDMSGPLQIPKNITRSDNHIGRSYWPSLDTDVSAAISSIKIYNRALNQSEIIFN